MAADGKEDASLVYNYPLCKHTDMQDDMKSEAMEIATTAVEKYTDNYEKAAKMVKEGLDRKFGSPFNVVIGEAYSYSVAYQEQSMLLMYAGSNVAALIWRTVVA